MLAHHGRSEQPAIASLSLLGYVFSGWPGLAPPLRVPNEGILFPSLHRHTYSPRELPDCPSLRASDEHRFIVRVLRARRMVWRLPFPSKGARSRAQGTRHGYPPC
jgi:hypothetical protein